MVSRKRRFAIALLAAATLASACTSRDEKATAAASAAQVSLQGGDPVSARRQIQQALAIRDDIPDYWMLLAEIGIAQRDFGTAFNAYENVLTLDRTNREALTRLCQIAINGDAPERAERYADQLAALTPDDSLPGLVKAGAALKRGDKGTARTMIAAMLKKDPKDPLTLVLQSKLLAAEDDFAGAAQAVEAALAAPGDPGSRLIMLRDYYARAGNRTGYADTVGRLARAFPEEATFQLLYAAALYDQGDRTNGYAVTKQVMTRNPDDLGTANTVLALWLEQGGAAVPAELIATDGAAAPSLEAQATYAQYANEINRPDLALRVLDAVDPATPPSPASSDALAARAYAQGIGGDRAGALAAIGAILAVDPTQPRALLARARLRAQAGEIDDGLRDARRVLADDGGNASARLTVADLLVRQNQPLLAERVLRDAIDDEGSDPRIATRLARLLIDQGRRDEAADALATYARANPTSRRAQQLGRRA